MSSKTSWHVWQLAKSLGSSSLVKLKEHSETLWTSLENNFGLQSATPLVWVDCRGLGDPGADHQLRGHKGMHPAIIRQMDTQDAKQMIMQIMRQIMEYCEHDEGVNVIAICKAGRHRSVAVSVVLRSLLEKMGLKVTTKHTSEGKYWKYLCKTSCEQCHYGQDSEVAKEVTVLLDSFDQAWRQELHDDDHPTGTSSSSKD